MPMAWRIGKAKYADTMFSGEGARLNGARWNSPGRAVIYLAEYLSLAQLETLVNLGDWELLRLSYVAAEVTYSSDLVEKITPDRLPENWDELPPGMASRDVGDQWFDEERSALLAVPSVVTPGEYNLLLNLSHVDASEIVLGEPIVFRFDHRLSDS